MNAERQAVIEILKAVADAIRELGEIPSGHLYAQLMGHMSLELYQKIIGALVAAKLVEEQNHLLRWIGPEVK